MGFLSWKNEGEAAPHIKNQGYVEGPLISWGAFLYVLLPLPNRDCQLSGGFNDRKKIRGNTIRGNRPERGNLPLRGSLRGRVSEVFRGF